MHTVMTAVRHPEKKNLIEQRAATLPVASLAGKGEGEPSDVVELERIVSVGISPTPDAVRLALDGACYVDVERRWFNQHQAGAGKFYVKHTDGSAECLSVEELALRGFTAAPAAPSVADLDAVAAEEQAKEETSLPPAEDVASSDAADE